MGDDQAIVVDVKRMRLRYAGTCAGCTTPLAAGTTADYHRASGTVTCVECPPGAASTHATGHDAARATDDPPLVVPEPVPQPVALPPPPRLAVADGQGGASAAVEYQRRHDSRQERVLTNHPRIGRVLLAVFDDPQSTRAWSVGAEGERMLGEMLAFLAGDSLRFLDDDASRAPRRTSTTWWCSPRGSSSWTPSATVTHDPSYVSRAG